jgi:PAS domain S-box-containing protein
VSLAERMATSPKDVLEHLVQLALELCCAHSAGISLAEEQDGRTVFRWRAAAGHFAPLVGIAVPPDVSPSSLVLERREPTLFSRPQWVALDSAPALEEALLVPLRVPEGPYGTLWVVSHDETRRFDREDARVLASLSRFAALGLQTLSLLVAETHSRRDAQHALTALRESEQRFSKFMQRLPGLAWIKDLEGRYVFVNDAAEQAFRHPREELLGRSDAEIFPADVAAQFRGNDADALASGTGIETIETLEHPDGVVHHSIVSKFPIPGPGGEPSLIGGVAIDITARVQAEEVIRESEERFRAMADNAPAIIYVTQPDGYCTFLSSAWTKLTGRSGEVGLGFGWGDAVHPDDLELTRSVFAQDPPAMFRIEFRLASKDGGYHWVIGTGAPRHSQDGAFLGYVGSVLDIDKEKRTEDALRNSVQLYRAIGESIDYGVWVCDPTGRNVYASQSFLNLVGLSQEECSDFGWSRALHPDDVERTRASWEKCVRSGEQWDIEHRFRGVDGRWHPVLARGVRVRNERGETTAWAGINLDISRLKQVEDELREVDRRKDEFLATLAHELRNPLAPIRNSLHVLRLEPDPAQNERVHQMIDRQVNHLIRLVDDLLEVARITSGKIELRRERIELAEVVRTALETSRPAIERAQHELEVSVPAQGLELDGDGVRLA